MTGAPVLDVEALIDDRADEGVFRVDRRVFRDADVFEAEMAAIFEGTWVFVGLESQVAEPHDFFTTHIGRQPVLVTRDGAGVVRAFLNTCRHRGTVVCPFKAGKGQKHHVCRYHGWAYDSGGRNVLVTDEADGAYPRAFANENHDLFPVARLDSYRGLIFASLSPDVPPLEQHLGDARAFIDLAVDHGPAGLEYVPGEVAYTYDGNWKLQFENGLDFYHFASTHSSYVDIARRRPKDENELAIVREAFGVQEEGHGTLSFGAGHAVMWSIRNTPRGTGPLAYSREALDALRARVGDTRAKWMVRQRNLTIFPNLQIIDISTSLQLRTWRPLAPDRTEM
ncbi:MAG TPA: Rieske 2Fe-2S domain-containing protein, partial [Beijerinckiaceae bacterium]